MSKPKKNHKPTPKTPAFQNTWVGLLAPILGLAAMLYLNYFLRHTLENAAEYVNYAHFDVAAPGMIEKIMSSHSWTYFLLPLKEYTGNWQTTSLIVTYFLQKSLSPETTYYLFNALLIVTAFVTSQITFRSSQFSFTLALCLGFGTQLYHVYAIPGVTAWYLVLVYYLILLLSGYQFIRGARGQWGWGAVFLVFLIIAIMAYEGWLDFFAFAFLACLYLALLLWRKGERGALKRVGMVWGSMTILAGLYVFIKTRYAFGQGLGSESDVVFNYPYPVLMVEDMISKYLGYLYISLTNFLPPFLLNSYSLYLYGADKIVALQEGYETPYSSFIPMQHVFFWRYLAGALFAVFVYFLINVIKKSFEVFTRDWVALSIFMIMIAVSGPTHVIVKARPMTSVPLLGYHVLVSVLGVSLLISYLMLMVGERVKQPHLAWAIISLTWAVILYSALARPAMLGFLAKEVGIAYGNGYPDPLGQLGVLLKAWFGG